MSIKKHKIDVLIGTEELNKRVEELAMEISKDFAGTKEDVLFIGLLKGSVIFLSDLVRKVDFPISFDFISVSSYGDSMETSGVVKITKDLDIDITGKRLVIVEDIIDSGLTLNYVKKVLIDKGATDIKICTLLDKPYRRKADVKVDYCGFEIPDEFVVGYGIDYAEMHRQLPYIGKVTLLED